MANMPMIEYEYNKIAKIISTEKINQDELSDKILRGELKNGQKVIAKLKEDKIYFDIVSE